MVHIICETMKKFLLTQRINVIRKIIVFEEVNNVARKSFVRFFIANGNWAEIFVNYMCDTV